MMEPNVIEEREKRMAAIHEAAHAVICDSLGGAADAYIWRNESGDPYEKAYRGQAQIRCVPSVEGWRLWVGLAGVAATIIADEPDDECAADELAEFFDPWGPYKDEMSASDLAMIGDVAQITYGVAEKMVAMLRAEWDSVIALAEELMESVDQEEAAQV